MSAQSSLHSWLNKAFIAAGVLVVLVGAADLTARLARATLGANAGALAFAPVAAVSQPSTYGALNAATVASTTPLIPVRLRVPSIGVDAAVEQVGLNAKGAMGAPQKFNDVAWYQPGAQPGAPGSAVFAGHVNNALTLPGVFEHLAQVKVGDQILVTDAAGRTLTFVATQTQTYPVDQAPLNDIFATSGPAQLVLISCEGDWIPDQHQFNERLVVVAKLQ